LNSKNPYLIDYESIEPHPFPEAMYTQLQFKNWSLNLEKIHQCEWEVSQNITEAFKLTKYDTSLEKFENKCSYYNVIFLMLLALQNNQIFGINQIY